MRFYGPEKRAPALVWKYEPIAVFFVNDMFADGGDFCCKRRCRCVIVCLINSPDSTHRRVKNFTVRTARKMCGGNTARRLRLILARGVSGPVASPGQGFQPVDPTGAISSPGPTTKGAFVPALDPQTEGAFRAPSGHPSTRLSQPWTAPKG